MTQSGRGRGRPPWHVACSLRPGALGGHVLANIQDFLQLMLEAGASDLHVTQDSPPLIRVHGELRPLAYPPLTATDTRQLCYSILTEAQKKKFEEDSELDFSFAAKGVCRFRGNLYL